MKTTIIKYKTLFILLLLTLGFAGCGEDENVVMIDFFLMNSSGHKTNTFLEGENIHFRLIIENKGTDDVVISPVHSLFPNYDFLKVYDCDGNECAQAHYIFPDQLERLGMDVLIIKAGEKTELCYSWLGNDYDDPYISLTQYENCPLSKGHYYSKFLVQPDGNHSTICHVDFNIK